MSIPAISVILPLYNAENFIEAAVESVLKQTFRDFELIIIDDGSTDGSAAVVERIKDERIHFYKQKNRGMAAALNAGLSHARAELIARQDADDISHPERLKKQIDFLNINPGIGLVGTQARIIDTKGNDTRRTHKHETKDIILKAQLYFDNPIVHSSVLFRRSVLEKAGKYDESKPGLLQDLDLWFRFSKVSGIANLPEALQDYRELGSGISQTSTGSAELVAFESALHLEELVNDKEALRKFTFFYHNCFDRVGNMTGRAALAILARIKKAFAEKQGLNNLQADEAFEAISKHLKRAVLDHKVYKHKGNSILNTAARINRKLFYPPK